MPGQTLKRLEVMPSENYWRPAKMLLIALGFRINKPVPFLSDTIQSLPGLCKLTGVTEKKGLESTN